MKKLIQFYISLTLCAASFGASNFEKFKEETKNEEKKELKCPLNEKQERRVYEWFKKHVYDFDSLEILEWSPVYKLKKGIFQKTDPGYISIKVMTRGKTRGGGTTKGVIAFTMDENGECRGFMSTPDGYLTTDIPFATADMSTGKVY